MRRGFALGGKCDIRAGGCVLGTCTLGTGSWMEIQLSAHCLVLVPWDSPKEPAEEGCAAGVNDFSLVQHFLCPLGMTGCVLVLALTQALPMNIAQVFFILT